MLDSDYKKFKQDTIKTINDLIQKVSQLQSQVNDLIISLSKIDSNKKDEAANYFPTQMSADAQGGAGGSIWLPYTQGSCEE